MRVNNLNRTPVKSRGTLGLATGMDGESIVEGMLQPTRNRIDRQLGIRQQVAWRQERYRGFITQMNAFQQRFFSFQTPNSNLLSNTLFSRKTVTASAPNVTATATEFASSSLTINRVSQLAQPTILRSNSAVTAPIQLNINGSALATSNELTISLDGVTRQLTFNSGEPASVIAQINQQMASHFGQSISVSPSGMVTTQHLRQVTISGSQATLNALGLSGPSSNQVSLNTTLQSLQLHRPLIGEQFSVNINGVSLSFNPSETIASVLNRINGSQAGVIASYSSLTDSFELQSRTLGAGVSVNIVDEVGNLAQSMFGVGSPSTVTSRSQINAALHQAQAADLSVPFASNFEILVNGSAVTLEVPALPDAQVHTLSTVVDSLNTLLRANSATQGVQLSVTSPQSVAISSSQNAVSFADTAGLHTQLGLRTVNTTLSSQTRVGDLNLAGTMMINGIAHTIDASSTVGDVTSMLQTQGIDLILNNNTFQLTSQQAVNLEGPLLQRLFNVATVGLNTSSAQALRIDGSNAILQVNGVNIERNTNVFNVDGFNVTLNAVSTTATSLTTNNNVSQIREVISAFVADYNQLLDQMRIATTEDTDFRQFPPLTDAQRSEMSENEIKLWEERAKRGLLRNDQILTSLSANLRQITISRSENLRLSLADIGISAGSFTNQGRLSINENQLTQMLENNLSDVMQLFTHPQQGLGVRINEALRQVTTTSLTQPGSLVRLAGIANTASATRNQLTTQMTAIDDALSNLNRRYEAQRERFWRQFSQLETAMGKMNAQSSWLTQQIGMNQ